nr:MAG TPA: hypothetical protein [Caudoviricetes sp.]
MTHFSVSAKMKAQLKTLIKHYIYQLICSPKLFNFYISFYCFFY